MARDLSVGIDIGSHHIKVVAVGDNSGNKLPHIYATGFADSSGLRQGYATDKQIISDNVDEAVDKAAGSMQRAVETAHIAMGGASLEAQKAASSQTFDTAEHKITDADIEAVVDKAQKHITNSAKKNRLVLHRFPIAFKVDGETTLGRPTGLRGRKLSVQVLFVSALSQHVYDLVEAVEDTGIDVDDIVASPLAAAEVTLTDAQKIAGCILVNIGAETVSLVVYDNNQPISMAVFPIGSNDITNDIALGMKVDLEKAEAVKLGGLTSKKLSQEKLDEIVSARLEDIFELIEDHLHEIGREGLLPAGIVMTGGGAALSMVEDVARSTLDLPASITKLKLPKTKAIRALENSAWSVAYGTATYAHRDIDKSVLSQFKNSKNSLLEWFKQFLP